MNKKRFLPVIALLVLSLICACVPVQAQEALPSEAPAQAASETYGLKTEAVMERKVVPYVRDFLLTGEERGEAGCHSTAHVCPAADHPRGKSHQADCD